MNTPLDPTQRVAAIALEMFEALARQFPVCLSSDEFHFFPQYKPATPDWSQWDDFTPEAVAACQANFTRWKCALAACRRQVPPTATLIDIALLQRVMTIIGEQLSDVRCQETQPTFYLTIAGIGLAEALEAGDWAFERRVQTFPGFLRQARQNLRRVPALFRDLGLELTRELKAWLQSLENDTPGMPAALAALEALQGDLERRGPRGTPHLPLETYARVAYHHLGCRMPLEEIARHLDEEIRETRTLLSQEAERLTPGRSWQRVVAGLPAPEGCPDGTQGLYRTVIAQLKDHCIARGIISSALASACPVAVEPIPPYLAPIRSGAAYSMPPGHPPAGGTFFIENSGGATDAPPEYRLLAAHETFPGHHLLDTHRWSQAQPLRRHIEFPLFYEGWASFSEELLFDTGFFKDPLDRLFMAKRRFWRAMRGRVDLEIQTRRRDLDGAVVLLTANGMPPARARAMVRRYTLKPGYQLSYTIGRRRFRRLYGRYCDRGHSPEAFARRVLAEGQIGFEDLEALLIHQ
jgi:hypothetical protein